jgi:hypothetical protein
MRDEPVRSDRKWRRKGSCSPQPGLNRSLAKSFKRIVIGAVTNTLLPAIQNAELKHLVTKVAPAFVAHRDAAKYMLDNGTMSKM